MRGVVFQRAIDLLLGDLSHVLLGATFHDRLLPLCLIHIGSLIGLLDSQINSG